VKKARISLSDAAANDILEQADWYEEQANARLAKRF
jgi:plasmid stabilization system protein ParE